MPSKYTKIYAKVLTMLGSVDIWNTVKYKSFVIMKIGKYLIPTYQIKNGKKYLNITLFTTILIGYTEISTEPSQTDEKNYIRKKSKMLK